MMSLRWAVLTNSGKNLRIYAPNVLAAAKMLKQHGEQIAYACEAGCWHPHAKRPVLVTDEDGTERWTVVSEALSVPDWERSEIVGWPGGPSGRPASKKAVD